MPRQSITPESDLDVPDAPGAARDALKPKSGPLHPMNVPHDSRTQPVDSEQVRINTLDSDCTFDTEIGREPTSAGTFSECDTSGYTLVLKKGVKHLKVVRN